MISPCIRKCHLVDGICSECKRTKEEIIKWSSYSDDDRKEKMSEVKLRINNDTQVINELQ